MIEAVRLQRDVTESLRSQPGRAALSLLAVTIGAATLTLLLAMIGGLRAEARRMVAAFGAQVVAAAPDAAAVQAGGYRGLDRWRAHWAASEPDRRSALMARVMVDAEPWRGAPVWAVGADLAAVRGWTMKEGRWFDALDEANGARVAVITAAAERTAGSGIGTVGRIGDQPYTVIGIVREGAGVPDGSASQGGGEALVLVPVTAAERQRMPIDPGGTVLFLQTPAQGATDTFTARLDALAADPAWLDWRPRWITPDSLLAGIRTWQRTIALTAGSIATLCLLLGGTTLMSLMLAEVRQRIPEIGLRRALGATRRDVALLFVAESIAITGAAAIAGLVLAAALLVALDGHVPVPLQRDFFTFVIPAIVSIVIGSVFSFAPARMAAGLSPAAALRNG
jgi:putative ABC transport system permease protein